MTREAMVPARTPSTAILRAIAPWAALVAVVGVPIAVAAASPLLAWRDAVYVTAGFAGVVALALQLVQPLLAGGYLPGLSGVRGRRLHRWVGAGLLAAVVLHVAALWVTSPPDVIDALLFRSPTPFSVWGVIAMWAVFAAASLAAFRRRLGLRTRHWRIVHTALATVVVAGSVVHAMRIEGTMGTVSKAMLCASVVVATAWVIVDRRSWAPFIRRRPETRPARGDASERPAARRGA